MGKEKRRYFLTGLLIVLPVLITVYLFVSLFFFFDNILGRYVSQVTEAYFGFKVPGLGLLVFVLVIFFTGFIATNFIGRRILRYFETLWFKFPLIKTIYPAAKQVTRFLFGQNVSGRTHKVALIPFPSAGHYTIGFITNRVAQEIASKLGRDDFVYVLVATVPNPFSGFIVMVPRSEAILLDMGIEEVVKIFMSGGVLDPKSSVSDAGPAIFED